MIKSNLLKFLSFSFVVCAFSLSAQSSSMSSSMQGSSSIESLPPLPAKPPAGQQQQQKKPEIIVPRIVPPPPVPAIATYLHPGIIVFRDGHWQGSDHLLNLTKDIGVYVHVIKPDDVNLGVTDAQIKKVVEDVFKTVNINPQTMASPGQASLPAFEIEILAYPIEKGFAIAIDGKLFESVELERFQLDQNMAFQAITWEKKTLQVGPTFNITEQVLKSVQDIAGAFAERYKAYEDIKKNLTR
jgi:hypothetical protein